MARRRSGPKRQAGFANRLVVMAKSPVLGRIKRRLSGDIGEVAALRFYRTCLAHTLLRLTRDKRWRCLVAVAPDCDVAARLSPSLGRLARLPQGAGDLGRRMQRIFDRLPPGPVVIVGGDIPALSPRHVADAFRRLGNADAAFGQASDGGYWLVGMKRVPKVPKPFANVRWSSPHALADTLANLQGNRIAYAATLSDVDTGSDLRRQRNVSGRLILGSNPQRD
ncbi:MAG TPA: TIGR04282 family arsenosugar biosynthesis glycosyltransferase [Methyloceanibacter sp.]|nr:TIGR04282 family arsenosugar biosynthesis glycosyltransferase [Methyloceanibacter sp.]